MGKNPCYDRAHRGSEHMAAKRRKRRRRNRSNGMLGLIAILAAAGVILLVIACIPRGNDMPEEPVTTTTAQTTATTVPTTVATTTTTAVKTVTTKAPTADDSCWLDENGLLQFKTKGHYVQSNSVSNWKLMLVNDWNAMPSNYESTVSFVSVGSQKVDSRILEDLQAMLTAGKAYGIGVQSGYRSAEHQGKLYWRQVQSRRNNGQNELAAQKSAGQVVKRPGYSEHNTGLAVDLGGSGNFKLEQDFENTAAFKWLYENCANYGFILRFPKDKEAITGVIYEPWHYRYVGKEAARVIMDNGWCLEEYLEKTQQ